ncbi:BrnA antitoxin family protein [Brevundimonas aurifodinae]|uniref:BrnA antitoxin family protein n=1 Tax=Brevundimonas aurifodinae TaxID=1508312 RepID=UPI0032E399FB
MSEAPAEFDLDLDQAPELTAERAANLRPASEVFPEYVLAQFARSPGRPRKPSPKVQLTLRLDAEIIDFYKAGGSGWQSRMNAALRKGAGFTD